jgi:hypothetical protein
MLEKLFQKTYDSELDGFRLTYGKHALYVNKRYGKVMTGDTYTLLPNIN